MGLHWPFGRNPGKTFVRYGGFLTHCSEKIGNGMPFNRLQ
jgi:hypothetical protein